jgi:ATP-dependent phosphofructokinase / diphosphate-dependent phosphofructokinase
MGRSGKGVAVVAHSGGPTAVINASLAGVIEEASTRGEIRALYGARFGIDGILREDFTDLLAQPNDLVTAVARTPSSALGTSRREIGQSELEQVLNIFRAHGVRYFFYTGGNGSMGTAHQIQGLARESNYGLQVIGIPKTIDNDLLETDHTPGYASTARFFACAARDIGADNRALQGQVEIIEVLGRNVGWLAAATSLARNLPDDPPHLIYLPEHPLPLAQFLADVDSVFSRLGRCVVAVCEGQLDENGEPFGADVRSGSRGALAMNLGHRLAMLVSERLNIRARSEKPGLLGRSNSDFVSKVDWEEAQLCGRAAVRAALEDLGGHMVTLIRENQPVYSATTGLTELSRVAFLERLFPREWISPSLNDVEPGFKAYAMPLVGPIAYHPALESIAPFEKADGRDRLPHQISW